MKAGLVTGQRRFELVDVPDPQVGPRMAVVQIALCGICGTDLHGFLGSEPYNPAICGHEWVGIVSEIGAEVTSVQRGDRVVAAVAPACGRCPACLAGQGQWCQRALAGMVGRDALAPPHGGFAPAIALDAQRLVVVDEALTDEQSAMVEPTTVALHAVHRTPPTGTVVIQGCGPIGLLTLQCARALGAERIVAIDPVAGRRALAELLGADVAVEPAEARAAVGGLGADLVFECAGIPATVQSAVDLIRRGGAVNLVGLASGSATISPAAWLIAEVTVTASLGYVHHEFSEAMGLIADGRVNVDALHDRTVSLADAAQAFATLAADPTSATKVLVDPR
jgi:(R,R)-butanediol dehydrogenase/meso-butanediol dehydrogenase/diacetyl reductase